MVILVTGAKGFIGSHLSAELRANGHIVHGTSIADGDLSGPAMAESIIHEVKPDVVVHCAAKVGRILGEDRPEVTIAANAIGTMYVASACARHGARLVYVSSSEVYGDLRGRSSDETTLPALPHNLYGLTKRWGEEVAALYAPNGLQILRLCMPYGPGIPAGRGRNALINMLWQADHREPIVVHRGAYRSWCWIGDTVRGMRMVIEDGYREIGGIYNVGRDDQSVSMHDVALLACELTGAPESLIELVTPPRAQTVVKSNSMSKLGHLGWEPTVDLREGMTRTLEAMRADSPERMPCLARV